MARYRVLVWCQNGELVWLAYQTAVAAEQAAGRLRQWGYQTFVVPLIPSWRGCHEQV
jgi:hypothetical protein